MKDFKSHRLTLALVVTLIAVLTHAYLTKEYYQLQFGMKEAQSLCNINQTFNCDAVSASSFSSIFDFPLALLGFVTNLVLLFLIAVPRFFIFEGRERTYQYALLISLITVIASVVMGVVSLMFLSTYCLFCILAYILSLVGFLLLWGSGPGGITDLFADFGDWAKLRPLIFVLLSIPVLAFVSRIIMLQQYNASNLHVMVNEKILQWQANPVNNFTENGLVAPAKSETKWTIVEFADFLCPHCKHASPTLHAFAAANSNVKLIFKAFPLDGNCNPSSGAKGDGVRCELTSLVFCADKLNQKGWLAHDEVFSNQERIGRDLPVKALIDSVTTLAGLDGEALATCMKSEETLTFIQNMAREGEAAKISGTPSIFLNGRLLPGGQLLRVLQKAATTAP